MLTGHIGQSLHRLRQVPLVLAMQDTTECNLTHLTTTQGLGYGSHKDVRGFMMHRMLALSPEGLHLGILGMKTWTRPLEELGQRAQRRQRPMSQKESIKWIEGLFHLTWLKSRCPETPIVSVCDREANVCMSCTWQSALRAGNWLVRAAWNRWVAHPKQYLWEAMQSHPVAGTVPLRIPARAGVPYLP